MTAFAFIMFFICLTVLKLPYDAENALLLNCYYLLIFFFTVICYVYHKFHDNKVAQNRVLLVLKVITYIICCLGLYLFVLHFDYINDHINEWGSFNKVNKTISM